jgi:hypothetical protein
VLESAAQKKLSLSHVASAETMTKLRRLLGIVTTLTCCGSVAETAAVAEPLALSGYGASIGESSISGVSSGAFIAVQFATAWSAIIKGVGIVAGGPFWCAEADAYDVVTDYWGSIWRANGSCMMGPVSNLQIGDFVAKADSEAASGDIDTGYNAWADNNHLIALYPQTRSSLPVPYNPLACWDWWSYADHSDNYVAKSGAQIRTIKAMLDALTSEAKPAPESTPAGPPAFAVIDASDTGADLAWTAPAKPARYRISRAGTDRQFVVIGETTGSSFADTGLTLACGGDREQRGGSPSLPTSPLPPGPRQHLAARQVAARSPDRAARDRVPRLADCSSC